MRVYNPTSWPYRLLALIALSFAVAVFLIASPLLALPDLRHSYQMGGWRAVRSFYLRLMRESIQDIKTDFYLTWKGRW